MEAKSKKQDRKNDIDEYTKKRKGKWKKKYIKVNF